MAESVDATVSNTVGATHPGSSPGPGTDTAADNRMIISRHLFEYDFYLIYRPKNGIATGGTPHFINTGCIYFRFKL